MGRVIDLLVCNSKSLYHPRAVFNKLSLYSTLEMLRIFIFSIETSSEIQYLYIEINKWHWEAF